MPLAIMAAHSSEVRIEVMREANICLAYPGLRVLVRVYTTFTELERPDVLARLPPIDIGEVQKERREEQPHWVDISHSIISYISVRTLRVH